jgi:hypothetical protein
MFRLALAAAAASILPIPASAATLISESFTTGYGAFTPTDNVTLTSGNNLTGCCGATGTAANMSNQFVAFGGGNFPSGSISTDPITLVIGQAYTLTLDYGAFGQVPLVDPIFISIGAYSFTLTPSANDNFDTNRTTTSFSFLGNGQLVPLVISSGGAFNVDAFVDNVSLVSAPVPEPATWAMMLLGFGGIAFAMHRRSKSAAKAIA